MTLREYIEPHGRLSELAGMLGVSPSTVHRWASGRVPAERAQAVSDATGIPLHVLRADLWWPSDAVHVAKHGEVAR